MMSKAAAAASRGWTRFLTMELEPPRARDATRRLAAFRVPGWYWAVWRISWFDSARFARNVASDRYFPLTDSFGAFPLLQLHGARASAPLSSKGSANFMIPPQKCLHVRAPIRLKSILDGQ